MEAPILSRMADVIGPGNLAMTMEHAVKLALVGAVLVFALGLAVQPRFWKLFWKPAEAGSGKPWMTRGGMLVAYGLLLLIVGGTIPDAVKDTEHWPWSVYPMYSYMWVGRHYDDYRLYGVLKDDPSKELSLWTDERYLQPFDQSRMGAVLAQMMDKPGHPEIHEGLLDCLKRYEALRRGGRHPGPELVKLRLYHVFWTFDSYGSTIEKPDKKVLIDEVSLAEAEKS
jgi:hypothetical protein